jgi:hypothetical protein
MMTGGLELYRLQRDNGWQMAIELMRLRNHPSHMWQWTTNLQMFACRDAELTLGDSQDDIQRS